MKRFLKKALRWTAIVLATLAVLLLAFYSEEDWRGARDWVACQRDLAARGETLDLRQLVPPGNPADDLSKVPIFAPLFQKEADPQAPINQISHTLKVSGTNEPNSSGYLKNKPIDLEAWQKFYRNLPAAGLHATTATPAQDVLQVLGRFDSQLNEIDVALSNPNAFFPFNYDQPSKGHPGMSNFFEIAMLLQLRGIALLDSNQSELAEKDYLLSFKLMPPISRGAVVVNFLILAGMRSIDEAILWEGIHRRAWNKAQLEEMELALGRNDMLAMGKTAFRLARASEIHEMSSPGNEAKAYRLFLVFSDAEDEKLDWLPPFWIRPSGWNQQDKTNYSFQQQVLIDAVNTQKGLINTGAFPKQEIGATGDALGLFYMPYTTFAKTTGYTKGTAIARAETYRRLARLACRLEEYRIAHNAYPDKLDDLPDLPAHLNQEVLSEQTLQYHRKGDSYQLYSVGWDQKDNGGVYVAPSSPDGDWPWPSP